MMYTTGASNRPVAQNICSYGMLASKKKEHINLIFYEISGDVCEMLYTCIFFI